MSVTEFSFQAIEWTGGGLRLLDQRRLPGETRYLDFSEAPPVAEAIRDLVVRGAPAIGITAAYAVVLSAQQHCHSTAGDWQERVTADIDMLARARPTAVNLVWALERMRACMQQLEGDLSLQRAIPRAVHLTHTACT